MDGMGISDAPDRPLEVHREANLIGVALDNLGDEINAIEGSLVSVMRPEPPVPTSDKKERPDGPQSQLAQTLNGFVGRINQLRHNVINIKARLEV